MPLIKIFLWIVLVLLLINQIFLPAGVIIFILLIVELTRLWNRFALYNLEVNSAVYPARLFPDEETVLKIGFNNNKILPINLHWTQEMLPEIRQVSADAPEQALSGFKIMRWHDRYTVSLPLAVKKRGYYHLPPLVIEARDGLGLYEKTEKYAHPAVMVYPRIKSVGELEISPSALIGERKDKRPLAPDPLRIAGLRDYTPDIPARFISWKASAKKDELLAKVLEPSADLRICIAVDIGTFAQGERDEDSFEEALSVAASLAYWADTNRLPFGFIANGRLKELDSPAVIPISSAPSQMYGVLEALARLELDPAQTLDDLIQMERKSFPWGTTLVVLGKGPAAPVTSHLRSNIYFRIDKEGR
jgi:uncharacterized protein (DUF58 family)